LNWDLSKAHDLIRLVSMMCLLVGCFEMDLHGLELSLILEITLEVQFHLQFNIHKYKRWPHIEFMVWLS